MNKLALLLHKSRSRYGVYVVLAGLFFVLANLAILNKGFYSFVVSDGRGYYVYLPSVVIDHDLDFENQVREHSDVDFNPRALEERTVTGYLPNKYPIGLSLSLAPAFISAHVISSVIYNLTGIAKFMPDGYSPVYQLLALLGVLIFGLLTMIMCDHLLTHAFRMSGTATGLAVLTFWVGTNYSYYYFREPIMVHVVSAFWITCCIFYATKAFFAEKIMSKDIGFVLFPFAMALVSRPTNIFLMPFLLAIFAANPKKFIITSSVRSAVVVILSFVPVFLQMLSWKILRGSWIAYSYGSEHFEYWKDPYLFSTLFSSLHGLFFWSPLLLVAVAGLGMYLLRPQNRDRSFDRLLGMLCVGGLILWYLNSSWHQWWFGDAFGGRAFIELAPLFIFGLAFFYDFCSQKSDAIKIAVSLLVLIFTLYNYVLMALYIGHKIPRADYIYFHL